MKCIEESQSEGETYIFNTERGGRRPWLCLQAISAGSCCKINDAIDERKKSFNSWTKITANFAKTDDHEYRVELSISECGPYKLFSMDMNAPWICQDGSINPLRQLGGQCALPIWDLLQILMPPVPDGLCISDFQRKHDRTNNCAEYQQLEEGRIQRHALYKRG